MRVSMWIARRAAPGCERPDDLEARTRVGLLEGWVSIVANTVLAALKGWLGLMTGSLALMADAFHSFSDTGTSIVVVLGFQMARKPPDRKHPFGHGRSESIAGLVVAVLLAVAAVEIMREGVGRILSPRSVEVSWPIMAVVAATMVVKEFLARFSKDLSRIIGSDALAADAWHHRSDVLSTGLVIAAFLGARWGAPWLDGVMSVGVALLIGWAAFKAMKASLSPLLGERASDETYRTINELARSVDGVRDVHDVLVHRYGLTHVISLHVEAPDSLGPMELHQLSEAVEDRVAQRFPGHAIVHVDPVNRGHHAYARVKEILKAVIGQSGPCYSYHDLRVSGGREAFRVVVDVHVEPGTEEEQVEVCRRRIADDITAEFPRAAVLVHVESPTVRPGPSAGEAEGT